MANSDAVLPREDTRLRDLRRMRALATALLVLMLLLFVATSMLQAQWPWLVYPRAFAEAGMIGACADWFAVVALFRHPLGIPIPHTAIVPQSKQRIAVALGRFVANNFLSPRVVGDRIRDVDIAGWAARWIERPSNAHSAAQRTVSTLHQALQATPTDDVNAFLTRRTREGLATLQAAPLASRLLSLLWAHGDAQTLIERLVVSASSALANNRDTIRKKISQRSYRFMPKWVDGMVADRIINGVSQTLDEMREPNHPWRIELKAEVERMIDRLATDPEFLARGEELKQRLLDNPAVIRQIDAMWGAIETRLNSAVTSATLAEAIETALMSVAARIDDDIDLRDRINRWLRVAALRAVASRRQEIAAFIRKVVENWDTETLIMRIELQVGRDLQFIRINGTVVGGLVGLLIFSVSQWF
ncbi:hypothetical protein UP10_28245 [Bradyrhizobium sp. LTSPM299]|uniref:DUF445 domain-containing protein n=1 Tax=Bradyrhizobium sp. LTSPM299 TaxID=1619233 RepID=UPI0005C9DFFF|nr:DUF445 domain-containing protein [Bradyrhizobium sp. LTSPM299]KJC57552.1 hypothetical protein UP10_28245 [Bradyrhizobium sp. LTSPM299]